MRFRFGLPLAALAALICASLGVEAQTVAPTPPIELGVEEAEDQPVPVVDTVDPVELDIPETAVSTEHVDMIIEGALTSVRSRQPAAGERQYNLTDIAEPLRSRVELHDTLLGYHRFQDGTLMSINMADGKVRSNKVVLGKLPEFEPRETADPWIGLNAVTVMTGTHASEDERGRIVLTLDKRLKPQFGLELWVNGEPIDTFGNEPRTIGPVLLVPLEPVVEALDHELTVENGTVSVRRKQDQANINLELATGLISVNTTPRGVTLDMQFAERDTLLLPFGAIESLTGTHIKLAPGTNRVEVNLDNRLDSTALPGADVAAEAARTPFTLESLSYSLSDRGPARLEALGHVGNYNFRAQLETAGGLSELAGQQPGWASVDISSLKGWNATVGDYNSSYRELAGIGGTRIRGASWRKVTPSDTIIAIAAGVPVTGSKVESKRVAVPTFGGFVAGGRLISDNGAQDIGVSASISEDGETGALVAGGQKSYHFDNDSKGLQSAYIAADLGVFSGDESTADIRARATINYAINEQVGISAAANYEGSEFASGRATSTFEGVFDQRVGARTNLSAGANWRADEPWGAFNRVAFGLRTSLRHEGGEADRTAVNVSANMNTQIGESGPNVSVTLQQTSESTPDVDRDSTSLRVRGLQRYDWGSVTASYTHSSSDDSPTSEQFVATVQANPIRKTFEKEVRVQVAPNATLNWDGETTRAYLGASAIADSGRLLGSKLDILGRVSAFSNFSAEDENANTTQFLGSLEARYRLNRAAHLTAVYTDDFQGRQDLSLALRGTVTFNPPRQSRLPDEGRGLLNGRVFLDRNRDGIRQEDEPGVPGVRVMLVGTRLGLNTNIDGHFTIQNVNQGLYTVTINRKSLPLGYLVPEEAQPRVTIGSGRRTDVEIPLILSGQVRGAVFIDDNANGVTDPGEKRLEGQWVTLIPENGGESQVIHSASFGQYGFENVDPGIYTLRTTVSGRPVSQQITISGEDPFVIVPIPIPPDLTSKGGGVDLSAGVLGEP